MKGKKRYLIACICFFACTTTVSNKCLHNNKELHTRFMDMFKVSDKLIAEASKEELEEYHFEINIKERLFSKICPLLDGSKRVLYLEQISPTNNSRIGLLYLYEKDMYINFHVDRDRDITADWGYNSYESLKKAADIVKSDFEKQANRLKKYFDQRIMSDVPYLILGYIDLSDVKGTEELLRFRFGGIISNEFDKEFIHN